jgi:hypothetical protein
MYNEADLDFLYEVQIAAMQLQAITKAQERLTTSIEEICRQLSSLAPEKVEMIRQKFPQVFEYVEHLEATQAHKNKKRAGHRRPAL